MTGLTYRNARPEDLTRIVAIYNSTIPSRVVTADTEPVTVESRKEWFSQHNPQNRPLWIVENALGQMIGWVSFQSFYGRPAYKATSEISIYLDESQRGRGFGQAILQYCIESCPKLGIKNLLGFIFSHNQPSLGLFRKLGFEDWGTFPNIAIMDGKEYGLKILGRRVD